MDTKRSKKHAVRLTDDQRADLTARFAGPLTPRQRNRVPVLLRADAGDTDADIADDPGVATGTAADADQGSTGAQPAADAAAHGMRLAVVKPAGAKRGFVLLPRRWVVERSSGRAGGRPGSAGWPGTTSGGPRCWPGGTGWRSRDYYSAASPDWRPKVHNRL